MRESSRHEAQWQAGAIHVVATAVDNGGGGGESGMKGGESTDNARDDSDDVASMAGERRGDGLLRGVRAGWLASP